MENNSQTKQCKDIKIYHQKITVNPATKEVKYLGEDSRPFVNKEIIMVADGLGGRGGYPHYTAKEDIIDEKKLEEYIKSVIVPSKEWEAETPITEAEKEEYERIQEILHFTKENFTELLEMSEQIKKDKLKMRSSGYFASRLLTASFLMTVSNSAVLGNIKKLDEENIQKWANKKDGIRDQILSNLKRFAKVLGLKNDSKTRGNYLLPATITSTILYENKDSVDAIYFWAGDTRGYIWTEEEGLQQVTKDHENGETMYNLFKLDSTPEVRKEYSTDIPAEQDGFIPTLEVKRMRFTKPCFIFNTSDGIYKCHNFASPIDLEYLLIDIFSKTNSIEDATKEIQKIYGIIGLHDDSNTLAGKFFGYKDYEDFKKAVIRRKEKIAEEYLKDLPGLFDEDYEGQLRIINNQYKNKLRNLVPLFRNEEVVKTYIKNQIVTENFSNYNRIINNKKIEISSEQEEVKAKISGIIKKNWKYISNEYMNNEQKIEKFRADMEELASKYKEEYQENLKEIQLTFKELEEKLEKYSDIEEFSRNPAMSDVISKVNELQNKVCAVRNIDDNSIVGQYNKTKNKIYNLQTRNSEPDPRKVREIIEKLLNDLSQENISEKCEQFKFDTTQLVELLEIYVELETKLNEEITLTDEEWDELIDAYWKKNSEEIVKMILDNQKDDLSEELIAEINNQLNPLLLQIKEKEEILERRQKIYDRYEQGYNYYLNSKEATSVEVKTRDLENSFVEDCEINANDDFEEDEKITEPEINESTEEADIEEKSRKLDDKISKLNE